MAPGKLPATKTARNSPFRFPSRVQKSFMAESDRTTVEEGS